MLRANRRKHRKEITMFVHPGLNVGRIALGIFILIGLATCTGLAAGSESPTVARPAPAASFPTGVSATIPFVPHGFVSEVVNVRYRECGELLLLVDRALDFTMHLDPLSADAPKVQPTAEASRNGSKAIPLMFPPPQPTHLLSLLPEHTQIHPYRLTNSIILVSTPDGLKLAKQLIESADTKPHLILVRLSVVSLEPITPPPAGQNSASPPNPFSIPAPPGQTAIYYLGMNYQAAIGTLSKAGKLRVLSNPHIIVPADTEQPLIDPYVPHILATEQTSAYVDGAVVPQLNGDGSITLYAKISAAVDAQRGPLNVPGLRMADGETLLIDRGPAEATGPTEGKGQQPGAAGLLPGKRILYLLTVNLVSFGGIIPGGGDAVRNELQKIESEGAPDESSLNSPQPGHGGIGTGIEGGGAAPGTGFVVKP